MPDRVHRLGACLLVCVGLAAADVAAATPTESLTLRQAAAWTLRHNPSLRAFAHDVEAAEARAREAGLWPNPELEYEMGEFGGTGPLAGTDAAELGVSLGQTIPLGGDVGARRALADGHTRRVAWGHEEVRLDVLTELHRRFVGLLVEQRRLQVAEEELDLAEAVLSTVVRRVEAGSASEVERIRARVPVVEAQVTVRRALRRVDLARARLARMWDGDGSSFTNAVGDLDTIASPPPFDIMVALLADNPQVARWAAETAVRRAEADLARAEAIPDVTARIGVRRFREIDAEALSVGVSFPVPLFDRNQGREAAARRAEEAARARRRAAELRVEDELERAWVRLTDAHDEATALAESALPAAREAFEVTRRAFESGDVEFVDVLDVERTLVQIRRQRVAALQQYHEARAAIEGLIARPLDALTADSEE